MDGQEFVVLQDAPAGSSKTELKEDPPTVCGPRPRVVSSVVLEPGGQNYISWVTILPTVLDGEPFAWDVTSGTLVPPDATKAKTPDGKTQMKNFNIGNKATRYVLFNSISQDLAVELFADSSQTPLRYGRKSRRNSPTPAES